MPGPGCCHTFQPNNRALIVRLRQLEVLAAVPSLDRLFGFIRDFARAASYGGDPSGGFMSGRVEPLDVVESPDASTICGLAAC
jgi:hypothetical protein